MGRKEEVDDRRKMSAKRLQKREWAAKHSGIVLTSK